MGHMDQPLINEEREEIAMDRFESIANKYLQNAVEFGSKIIHEPDGNIPPDFLINGKIAVEVRRLDENYPEKSNSKFISVEGVDINIQKTIIKELNQFKTKYSNETFYIGITLNHSFRLYQEFPKEFRAALCDFLDKREIDVSNIVKIGDDVELEFYKRNTDKGKVFTLGGISNDASGGLDIGVYTKEINNFIRAKNQKINNYKHKYREWWLLLVDTIGFRLDVREIIEVKKGLCNLERFSRLIVINYDSSYYFSFDKQV
ncbi:MAG: hypothetical protein C0391_05625 [Anaerolinea sp.]|nr:hypothetical protein [Anaerolinea sp.]